MEQRKMPEDTRTETAGREAGVRLESMGSLARGLIHRLNNPTSIILTRVDCMLADLEDGTPPSAETLVKDLLAVKKHTERIVAISGGLRILHEPPTGNKTNLDAAAAAKEAFGILGRTPDADNITMEVHGGPLSIHGYGVSIIELLHQLMKNAADAMPDGGKITVTLEETSDGGKKYAAVKVADEGEGIPEDLRKKIFNPYFGTRDRTRSSGLGLNICEKIIFEHGGYLEVSPGPGGGTVVTAMFPAIEENR